MRGIDGLFQATVLQPASAGAVIAMECRGMMKLLSRVKSAAAYCGFFYLGAAAYAYMELTISAGAILICVALALVTVMIIDFVQFHHKQQSVDRTDASPNATSA